MDKIIEDRPIHFEYQDLGTVRFVALDSKLTDYQPQPYTINGKVMMQIPEKTIKDCTKIDGCIYLHLGRVSDSVMIDLIEKFQKLLKERGWKKQDGINTLPL